MAGIQTSNITTASTDDLTIQPAAGKKTLIKSVTADNPGVTPVAVATDGEIKKLLVSDLTDIGGDAADDDVMLIQDVSDGNRVKKVLASKVLGGGPSATPFSLSSGNFLSGGSFDGSAAVTFNVQASSANQANKVAVRDANGGFAMGPLVVEETSRYEKTANFVEDINVGTEIRSAAYRIDQLADKSSFAANDVFLVNSSTQVGKSFSVKWSTLQAQLGGTGGGSKWYEIGGNAIRPLAPNTGINLTGGGAFGGTVSAGALTTTGNCTVGVQLKSATLITTAGIDCGANLTVRGVTTHVGQVTCQKGLTATNDVVAGGSLGAGVNVSAGSTFFGQSLVIQRNGTANSPAITIGQSSNALKMTMWSTSSEVDIGQNNKACIKFTGGGGSGSEFKVLYGINDVSGGNGLKIKSNGTIVQTGSSRTLKQNIQDLNISGLFDILDNARMVSFEYKTEPGIATVGMIADELYDIDTRFVYAEEGVPLGINYEMLTLPLIAGYRQQKALITALDATVANLTADVDANEVSRKDVIEFESNLTQVKNSLRSTYINIGNNIELVPAAAGGRVEITGDLVLDASDLTDAADDTAAAAANVVVGGVYHNNGVLRVRLS